MILKIISLLAICLQNLVETNTTEELKEIKGISKYMKYSINYLLTQVQAINLNSKVILFDMEKKARRQGFKNASTKCY